MTSDNKKNQQILGFESQERCFNLTVTWEMHNEPTSPQPQC